MPAPDDEPADPHAWMQSATMGALHVRLAALLRERDLIKAEIVRREAAAE